MTLQQHINVFSSVVDNVQQMLDNYNLTVDTGSMFNVYIKDKVI